MRKTLNASNKLRGSWLIGCLPLFGGSSNLKEQPCAQENFVLGGSVVAGGMGTMGVGCYRYTPPHVAYGPKQVSIHIHVRIDGLARVLKQSNVMI